VVEAAHGECGPDRRKVKPYRERAHLAVDPTVVEVPIEVGGITDPRTIAAPTHTIGGVTRITIAATTHTTDRIRTTTQDSASGSDSDSPSGIRPSITVIPVTAIPVTATRTLTPTGIHTRALDTHIQRDRRRTRRLTPPLLGPPRATRDRA
jgi:hypothetical protein